MSQETFEERILDLAKMTGVPVETLTEKCEEMKVSEFNKFENDVITFVETGNRQELNNLLLSIFN